MPSSSFIVNSEFQPMSYQELLHPVITQTQYQRELDEKYTQLDLQADKLEQLANNAVDRASYERYKSFANRLREEAGNLSKYGLRGRDNARFMELFRSYGKEIQPLLDAQAKRERLIAMQQQLSLQDPTSLYDRSAGNISLEELMRNPSAAPIRQSGELLRQQSAAMAQNLTNEIKSAVFTKAKTPGYLAFTQKYGISSDEVAAFVANPNSPQGNKVLRAIYDQVMTSSGVKQNWEGDAYKRASQYVAMGLWSAIGKSGVQPLQDVWGLQKDSQAWQSGEKAKDRAHQSSERAKDRAAQRAAQERQLAEQRRARREGFAQQRKMAAIQQRNKKELMAMQAGMAAQITGKTPVTPIANMNDKQQKLNDKNVKYLVDNGYIIKTKTGRYVPSKKGLLGAHAWLSGKDFTTEQQNKLNSFKGNNEWERANNAGNRKAFEQTYKNLNQTMYNFIKKADPDFSYSTKGVLKYSTNTGLSVNKKVGDFNNAFNKYIQNSLNGFDLHASTRYAVDMGASEGASLLGKLTSGKSEVTVYDSASGKSTKKSTKDLRSNTTTTAGRIIVDTNGKGSAYLEVDVDGTAYNVPITKSIVGASAYNNAIKTAKYLDTYTVARNKGYMLDVDNNGNITGVSKQKYNPDNVDHRAKYNTATASLDDAMDQLGIQVLNWGVRGKTKEQEVEYLPQPPTYWNMPGVASFPSQMYGGYDFSNFDEE